MTPPRFVPFEVMSDAEQREHLRRVHGMGTGDFLTNSSVGARRHRRLVHEYDEDSANLIHTHDKPVRCTCWPVENPWTHYGIVEPGGAMEWNPDCCRQHRATDAPVRAGGTSTS